MNIIDLIQSLTALAVIVLLIKVGVAVGKQDWAKLADEVLQMRRQFKTDIENAMALSAFKRPVAA